MRVLILGGGFCGALLARILDKRKDLDVALFDKKDYFEYTPSIHKVIFNAGYHRKIVVPFRHFLKRVNIVNEPVIAVTPGFVETKSERYSYDYLVVCIGIDYPVLLDNKENVCTLKNGLEAAHMGAKILSNNSICIIGGGLIGTEIAGELVTKTHGKAITIVHPHGRLLERNPVKASDYARKFLEKHNARIIFGEKVVKHEGNKFITDKNTVIEAGAGLWCAGIRYNTLFMKEFSNIFTEKGA
ncbi:MAG TPA: FAD-dependent oxidoreductase, partial [Candidatus Nanoarchaeia archaeon]|nr:FAD-dependent oxidoreductase [Candidatus Nanoarchaeia archaeon]